MQWTYVFDIKKIFLVIAAFMLLCLSSAAQESLITSVSISKPKELYGAYQLTVKTDKPVEYKEKIESSDSIYFDIKNAITIDNLDTIYDNVSGIDALIVQQLENNKVRIYVNGVNTSNTKFVLKTKQQTGSSETNQITLNRPIREYRPTNDINEIGEENIDWDDNSFNPEHLFSSFFGLFGQKSDMTLVVCIMLLVACVIISKKVFAKVKLQEEPLIGLSSTFKTEKDEEQREQSIQPAFTAPKRELPPMRAAQNITSAYAQRLYKPQRPQVQPQPSAIKKNYALNAYQNSQKNPYVTNGMQNRPTQSVSYQKRVQRPSNDYVSRVQKTDTPAPRKQGASVESIKFLESVTKIYEQSGRKDLAQGLRDGINRRRSAV